MSDTETSAEPRASAREEYEIVYRDGVTDTLDLTGREASRLAAARHVTSVSRVTGFGANARRLT